MAGSNDPNVHRSGLASIENKTMMIAGALAVLILLLAVGYGMSFRNTAASQSGSLSTANNTAGQRTNIVPALPR